MRLRTVVPLAMLAGLTLGACTADPQPSPGVTRTVTAAPTTSAADDPAGNQAGRAAALPQPTPTSTTPKPKPVNHCKDNFATQKIRVSLRAQHMWLCARHRTVYDTAITSGMVGQYTETPRGDYWIEGRNTDTTLTLNTGATYAVKYWIPFDAPLFGFHDSSWQDFPYGSAKYKTDGSHGCIHVPLQAIAFLYRWVAQPTSVHIA